MALYGLLMLGPITYWNAFGFDRSAAQGYFSWPIRFRDALIAKNIAVAFLLVPQIVAIAVVGRVARLPASPGKFLETVVVDFDRVALLVLDRKYLFGADAARDGPGKNESDGEQDPGAEHLDRAVPAVAHRAGILGARGFRNEFVFGGICWSRRSSAASFIRSDWIRRRARPSSGAKPILLQLSRSDGPLSIT